MAQMKLSEACIEKGSLLEARQHSPIFGVFL